MPKLINTTYRHIKTYNQKTIDNYQKKFNFAPVKKIKDKIIISINSKTIEL